VFDIEDELTMEHGDQAMKIRSPRDATSVPSTPKQSAIGSHGQLDSPTDTEHINLRHHRGQQRIHANPQRLSGVAEVFSHDISPLAQVYSPLQVDEDMDGNGVASNSIARTPPATSVSYGPTIRHRHVHRRMSNDHTAALPFSWEGLSIRRSVSGPASHDNEGYSPDEHRPKSDTDVESEGQLGGEVDLELRLAGIEERQKRIESMLMQLIEKIGRV
jgi:hypothetical protein